MKEKIITLFLLASNLSFAQNAETKVTMNQLIDSTAIVKWISENSYDMGKDNNILAYNKIDSIARVKKIIGIGEPAHGVKTIYESRNELAKYLIQKCNYNIIALEMHFNVGVKVNEYISTGKGNLKEILKSGHFFTNCQEYIDFFEWLKNYNSKNNKKVMIYGMDIQSNIDLLEDLFSYLNTVDKNIKKSTDNLDKLFTKKTFGIIVVSTKRKEIQ
ncbi:erythromycin esterase family protein [Bacteroides graminisolvens]|uniref:erythromycin esterase family protein n=1 Tax=Bacteroides graminisolvens TaxID=477666 RepID=UPI0029C6322B|nr:erythromycin esterase family protein [Bacteroides graminisolvens]